MKHKDSTWTLIWLGVMAGLMIWDVLFLNKPALKLVIEGFCNTFTIAALVITITLMLGWGLTLTLHYLESSKNRLGYLAITFGINCIRSVPQVVGVLFSYIGVAWMIDNGLLRSTPVIFLVMAVCMSLFIVFEMVDVMRDRIAHYKRLDFFSAMRVCGISQSRIINVDILYKNSRIHILNKLISVLGSAVFLQCSVDFIISVGLSTDVNAISLPVTLGSLLAKIDSKQDILAIGYTLTHPGYAGHLFFEHLQGISVAFLLVFTLLSVYHIANGYAERHRL